MARDTTLALHALTYVIRLHADLTSEHGAPTLGTQNQAVDFILADPELSRARPEGQSIVQVITRDGRRLEKRVTTFKGRSENPLTTYEVEEKALELLEPVLGQSRTRQLMDAIGKLETLASVRDLRPLLRA